MNITQKFYLVPVAEYLTLTKKDATLKNEKESKNDETVRNLEEILKSDLPLDSKMKIYNEYLVSRKLQGNPKIPPNQARKSQFETSTQTDQNIEPGFENFRPEIKHVSTETEPIEIEAVNPLIKKIIDLVKYFFDILQTRELRYRKDGTVIKGSDINEIMAYITDPVLSPTEDQRSKDRRKPVGTKEILHVLGLSNFNISSIPNYWARNYIRYSLEKRRKDLEQAAQAGSGFNYTPIYKY